jgi:hypothetical protein
MARQMTSSSNSQEVATRLVLATLKNGESQMGFSVRLLGSKPPPISSTYVFDEKDRPGRR